MNKSIRETVIFPPMKDVVVHVKALEAKATIVPPSVTTENRFDTQK